jgi:general nucleoside transport system permease protein
MATKRGGGGVSVLTDSGFWTTIVNVNVWQGTLRETTPLALAAIGGVLSERSGVVNIAMEGMMLVGAFFAMFYDVIFHNAGMGVLMGTLSGGVMALFLAFGAVRLRADQIVMGMAVNLAALGITGYLLLAKYGTTGTPPACFAPPACKPGEVYTIPDLSVPGLSKLPAVGQIIFQQNPIVYVMLVMVVAVHIFLFRTTLGLRIRAVGEHPRAADTAGINVPRLRYLTVTLSGVFSGLAGAYLSLSVGSFSENMTSGRGFIALAAMIFGKWTPFGAFGACLLFGFGQALYIQLQNTSGPLQNYSTLVAALPYLLTIVALAGFIGRSTPPAADGIPYDPAAADA